ncbi:MAG: trigger factor [Candidatus Gracilibacteria bacterium]|jgi:trigger factor
MDYKIKKLPKSEVELEITLSAEDLKKHEAKACEEISKDIKVPGFRPGHIPPEIVRQNIGEKYIIARTQELAIQRAYADVALKEKINVVSRPKVKILKDDPFTFTATVAVMPEIEVPGYKSIKIKAKEVKVTEKDVEEALNDLKKYTTTYKEVDREAKKGDRAEIDFEGTGEDGKPDPNTASKNHPVVLGENTLIPGFEEQVIGLKKGQTKEFEITFPKDYHNEKYRNKKMKFKVEVKMVEEPVAPEVNEEFVEKMTGKKMSVNEFKNELEKNILHRKQDEAKHARENEYIEELIKKAKIELPEALIEEEIDHIIEDVKDDMGTKGMEFSKFLEKAKISEEELRKKYRAEAEKRLRIRMSLQYVIKEENIVVSDEKMKEEFEHVKSFYPEKDHKKIEEDFKKGMLHAQIEGRLIIRELFEKVLA